MWGQFRRGPARVARCWLRVAAFAIVALAVWASAAQAATGAFVIQFSPSSLPEGSSLSLNGDEVKGFTALLRPTNCTAPANWQNDSDAVFNLALPAGTAVSLAGGGFTYQGTAASAYYGAGPSSDPYGGQFTISGQVNPAHTLVTGTVTLSNAHDPFVSGCSGSYKFVAIPKVSAALSRPNRAAYQSQFVNFNYAAGVVTNLDVQANFMCGQSVDSATFTGKAYGYPTVQTTAGGRFSVHAYVLDEYGHIVSLAFTGEISPRRASGRIVVAEPPGGFTGVAGDSCSGNHGWTASKSSPVGLGGPAAFFDWGAVRAPVGAAYRYYFAIFNLTCNHGATEVLLKVAGRHTTVPCSRREAFGSGPLTPLRTYSASAQAVEVKHGRVIRRGIVVPAILNMPGPNDRWVPISGLPGTPPS